MNYSEMFESCLTSARISGMDSTEERKLLALEESTFEIADNAGEPVAELAARSKLLAYRAGLVTEAKRLERCPGPTTRRASS